VEAYAVLASQAPCEFAALPLSHASAETVIEFGSALEQRAAGRAGRSQRSLFAG
jgi:hypothetical protein